MKLFFSICGFIIFFLATSFIPAFFPGFFNNPVSIGISLLAALVIYCTAKILETIYEIEEKKDKGK